jgi:hypothetical protein
VCVGACERRESNPHPLRDRILSPSGGGDSRQQQQTIDAYKHRVQEKLGLEHRTDYVRFAIEAGILGS